MKNLITILCLCSFLFSNIGGSYNPKNWYDPFLGLFFSIFLIIIFIPLYKYIVTPIRIFIFGKSKNDIYLEKLKFIVGSYSEDEFCDIFGEVDGSGIKTYVSLIHDYLICIKEESLLEEQLNEYKTLKNDTPDKLNNIERLENNIQSSKTKLVKIVKDIDDIRDKYKIQDIKKIEKFLSNFYKKNNLYPLK